jgi:hypothetical protein
VPVARADGFGVFSPTLTPGQRVLFAAFTPFKRLWRADWFALVVRVGDSGVEQIPLTGETSRFTARNDGELLLFVNDAILPVAWPRGKGLRFGWSALYVNNYGMARITIRRIG